MLRAFAAWWPPMDAPKGMSTSGTPKASGSAMEEDPARPTMRSADARAAPISSFRKPYGR
jgi:hypothetical protein